MHLAQTHTHTHTPTLLSNMCHDYIFVIISETSLQKTVSYKTCNHPSQCCHTSGVPQNVLVVSVWEMPSLHSPKSVKMMCPFKERTQARFQTTCTTQAAHYPRGLRILLLSRNVGYDTAQSVPFTVPSLSQ